MDIRLGVKDVSFLKEFPELLALNICTVVYSFDPINSLHNLKELSLDLARDKTPLRFSEFSQLEECHLVWDKNVSGIFICENLKTLALFDFKEKNINKFLRLKNLEKLALVTSPLQDLRGIGDLKKLKVLSFTYLRKLEDFTGLEELPALENLSITACGRINLGTSKELKGLKSLDLYDLPNLKSIKDLFKFPNLEAVFIWGSTSILDGDLSFFSKLKKLKKLMIVKRRHYSPLPDNPVVLKALESAEKERQGVLNRLRNAPLPVDW
jgi:Leucine-rich repeat (LRR) protein